MSQYIAVMIEEDWAAETWGPFPTPDAAAEWLGTYDARLQDFLWKTRGDRWFATVEVGDLETAHFQILPLGEPIE